jgi:hypothetical protein
MTEFSNDLFGRIGTVEFVGVRIYAHFSQLVKFAPIFSSQWIVAGCLAHILQSLSRKNIHGATEKLECLRLGPLESVSTHDRSKGSTHGHLAKLR